MRYEGNPNQVNYEPNSFGGPVEDKKYVEPPLKISGDADRYDHRKEDDYYSQSGNLFRLMNDDQKQQLFNNVKDAMGGVPDRIKARQLVHFYKADEAYGKGVADALGFDFNKVKQLAELSFEELKNATSEEGYSK
jgi:catalase